MIFNGMVDFLFSISMFGVNFVDLCWDVLYVIIIKGMYLF